MQRFLQATKGEERIAFTIADTIADRTLKGRSTASVAPHPIRCQSARSNEHLRKAMNASIPGGRLGARG